MQEIIETFGPNSAPLEFGVTLIDTHVHTFAVLTELDCNQGMSITNAADYCIDQANSIYGLTPKETIYVEQYENRTDLVRIIPVFNRAGGCLSVRWQPLPDNIRQFILKHMKSE